MAKNIGANLSIKDNFTSTSKSFLNNLKGVKEATVSATDKMKTMGSSSDSLGKKLLSTTAIVGGLTAAYQGMKKGVDFLKKCANAANAAEVSTLKLSEIMSNTGATEAQIAATKGAASALASYTTIGGSAARAGASQLAVFGLQADSINKLLPALGDMAVGINGVNVSSENMEALSKAVGKAMTGNAGALRKMGIVLDENSQKILKTGTEQQKLEVITNAVEKSYGGLAKTMAENTQEGNILMIQKAWASVKVTIGRAVLPLIAKTTKMLADSAPKIQKLILDAVAKITPAFDYFVTNIIPWVSKAIDGILWVADKVFAGIQEGIAIISSKFERVEGSAGGLGTAITNAFIACQPIIEWLMVIGLPIVASVIGDILVVAMDLFGFISANWTSITPWVMGIVGAIWAYNTGLKIATSATKIHTGVMKAYGLAVKAVTFAKKTLIAWKIKDKIQTAQLMALYAKDAVVRGAIAVKNGVLAASQWVVTAAQWAMNAAFYASPIGWIVLGIALLVGAFILLWKKSDGFRNFFISMWEKIKVGVSAFLNWIRPALQVMWTSFMNIWNGIKTAVVTIVSGIVIAVQWYFNLWWTVVSTVLTTIWNVVTSIWTGISATVVGVVSWITSAISNAWNIVLGTTTAIFGAVKSSIIGIWNGIVSGIQGCINSIISAINKMLGGIARGVNGVTGILNKVTGAFGIPAIPQMSAPQIPGLWQGGNVTQGGRVLVGERGPEFLDLPQGARVTPLDKQGTTNNIEININGTSLGVDEILNVLVPKLKLAIANM